MRRLFLVLTALVGVNGIAFFTAVGCGNKVVKIETENEGGRGGGGHGGESFTTSTDNDGGPPPDAFSDYVDPGCGDKPPPITDFQCDPYDQPQSGCALGEGCYIYVDYPNGPCAEEVYGSFCAPEGPGKQGDACGGGPDCAAGFVCVVSGQGVQCVELCQLVGEDGCPPGFVCEPIDVEGFGGCI